MSSIEHIHVSAPGVVDRFGNNLLRLRALPNDSEHSVASFLMVSTDLLCLQIAQMPRSQDVAIFMLTTDCLTPCCTCVRRVISCGCSQPQYSAFALGLDILSAHTCRSLCSGIWAVCMENVQCSTVISSSANSMIIRIRTALFRWISKCFCWLLHVYKCTAQCGDIEYLVCFEDMKTVVTAIKPVVCVIKCLALSVFLEFCPSNGQSISNGCLAEMGHV